MARLPDPVFFVFCKVQIVTLTSFHCSGLHIARHGMTLASGCFLNHLTVKVSCRCGMCWRKYAAAMACVVNWKMLYRNRCTTWWFPQVQLTKWLVTDFNHFVVGIDVGFNGGYEPCAKHCLITLGKGFKSLHMFHLPMFKSVRNLSAL